MNIKCSLNNDFKEAKEYSIERLESLLNFRFIPTLKYANWETEQKVKKICAKAKRKYLIDPLALWLGKLHKKDLLSPPSLPVILSWISPTVGYGLIAESHIPKWQFIGEYAGILRKRKGLWRAENDYCFRYPLPYYTFNYLTIDGGIAGNITRFINHSDNPNTESIGIFYNGAFRIIIRTISEIYPGEELTYHYGPLYWRHRRKRPELTPY